jgi:hypothetical protein
MGLERCRYLKKPGVGVGILFYHQAWVMQSVSPKNLDQNFKEMGLKRAGGHFFTSLVASCHSFCVFIVLLQDMVLELWSAVQQASALPLELRCALTFVRLLRGILGSVPPKTYGSGTLVHLHHSSKSNKSKKSQNSKIQGFSYIIA